MIFIYAHKLTPRLRYTFNFIFSGILGTEYELTSDIEKFKQVKTARLSYARQAVDDELFFQSKDILFENGITEQNISVFDWDDTKAFFATGKTSALPFDMFAASFYLLSRYEEYLPHIRDQYDRFDAGESIAVQGKFIHKPIIDIWALKLKKVLKERFPQLRFKERSYNYINTVDIDNAYAYKQKGLMRTMGGFARSLVKLDFSDFIRRLKVLAGFEADPYDTYQFLKDLQDEYTFKSIYFFLLADYGVNDKNVPHYNRKFQSLIKSIGDYAQIGIHPSFNSNKDSEKIRTEIERLAGIVHREVIKSRQHFLILHLPHTYRRLIDLDIIEDHTMGYASETGFRAGTCTPFYFYDLDLETKTALKVYPFAVMDATLQYYKKLSIEDAVEHTKQLIDEVRKVNGTFISLWHNETLSEEGVWRGWRKIYIETVKSAAAKQ